MIRRWLIIFILFPLQLIEDCGKSRNGLSAVREMEEVASLIVCSQRFRTIQTACIHLPLGWVATQVVEQTKVWSPGVLQGTRWFMDNSPSALGALFPFLYHQCQTVELQKSGIMSVEKSLCSTPWTSQRDLWVLGDAAEAAEVATLLPGSASKNT